MRSCRPFSSGWPRRIRSGLTPSFISQTQGDLTRRYPSLRRADHYRFSERPADRTPERLRQTVPDERLALTVRSTAAQQIPAVVVGQGKGMTVLSAQQPELAFKISAPDLIVFTDTGQGPAIPRRSALSLSVRYQAFTLEDIADSAGSRNGKIDVMIEEPHPQFFGPQSGCF